MPQINIQGRVGPMHPNTSGASFYDAFQNSRQRAKEEEEEAARRSNAEAVMQALMGTYAPPEDASDQERRLYDSMMGNVGAVVENPAALGALGQYSQQRAEQAKEAREREEAAARDATERERELADMSTQHANALALAAARKGTPTEETTPDLITRDVAGTQFYYDGNSWKPMGTGKKWERQTINGKSLMVNTETNESRPDPAALTQAEKNAIQDYESLSAKAERLREVLPAIDTAGMSTLKFAGYGPELFREVVRANLDPSQQQAVVALSDYTSAALKAASGLSASDAEFRRIEEQTPKPGDAPETIASKMASIDEMVNIMRRRAGANTDAAPAAIAETPALTAPARITPESLADMSVEQKRQLMAQRVAELATTDPDRADYYRARFNL